MTDDERALSGEKKMVRGQSVMMARNLHFVPVFYQEGFASKPRHVYVYRLGRRTEERSIRKTGSAPDFYAFLDRGGAWDNTTVEDVFTRDVDTPASVIFRKIRRRERLQLQEREALIRFIISLQRRTPKHKTLMRPVVYAELQERVRHMDSTLESAFFSHLVQNGIDFVQIEPAMQAMLHLRRDEIEETRSRYSDIDTTLDQLYPEVCAQRSALLPPALHQMTWKYLCAPEGTEFVTSDSPVYTHGSGLQPPFGRLAVPLTRKILLSISWKSGDNGSYVDVATRMVDECNLRTISNAWYEVYAGFRSESLRQLVDQKLGTGHSLGPGHWPPPWVESDIEQNRQKCIARKQARQREPLNAGDSAHAGVKSAVGAGPHEVPEDVDCLKEIEVPCPLTESSN